MNQLIRTDVKMTSLDIAEVTRKRHADVMRDIRKESEELGEEINQRIFALVEYVDKKGERRPCYKFGKDGAMQLALKYDAKTRYEVIQYVDRLENKPRLLTEKEQLKASMRLSLETSEEVEEIKKDVNMLKETMRIDGRQEHKLQKCGRGKVVKELGGKKSPAYGELSRSVFQMFWNEFKDHFTIPRYNELPKKDFNDALVFIDAWQPRTSTRLKIDVVNRQMTIDGDNS